MTDRKKQIEEAVPRSLGGYREDTLWKMGAEWADVNPLKLVVNWNKWNANELFEAIKHGDESHQAWLKSELYKWFEISPPGCGRDDELPREWYREHGFMKHSLDEFRSNCTFQEIANYVLKYARQGYVPESEVRETERLNMEISKKHIAEAVKVERERCLSIVQWAQELKCNERSEITWSEIEHAILTPKGAPDESPS